MRHLPLALVVLALGATAAAQSSRFGGLLVGNSAPTGLISTLSGTLYTQDITKCSTPFRRLTKLRPALKGGGGTAYDAARQAVWVTDGVRVLLKDLTSGTESCQFSASVATGARVTGLAHSNRRSQLIQLEELVTSTGSTATLRFYDTKVCPPKLLTKRCTITLPRGNTPGNARGLAYDELRDLIFFTSSLTGATGTTNTLHHVPYSVLCLAPPTRITLPLFSRCGGTKVNPVNGLAYDSCSRILYATDGTVTLLMDLSSLSKPINLNANKPCCKFGVSRQMWAGLAYIPKSSNSSVGSSCVSSRCASCTTMKFEIKGDLVLGNRNLALEITGAPAGGSAALYISLGACQSPGLRLPGVCGAIHPKVSAGQPAMLGSFGLGAGTGCGGKLRLPASVPPDPALCNLDLCAQFVVICPSSQGGGLTNAVQFRVGR